MIKEKQCLLCFRTLVPRESMPRHGTARTLALIGLIYSFGTSYTLKCTFLGE
jgi:hypothetical protein